jgi:hypothetical protein
VAEWLGSALQKLLQRFESARDLTNKKARFFERSGLFNNKWGSISISYEYFGTATNNLSYGPLHRHETMKYLTIILSIFLFSCQTSQDNNTTEFPAVNDEFTLYLKNFEKIELPIRIKGCKISSDDLKKLNGKQFSKYTDEYSLAYGQIPTNGNYIATITLGSADCYLPVLTTHKLNGQIIDQKTIAIGGCGSDCGFNCEEFMTLKKDFTFYTSDTVSTYTCDSLGNEIPETYQYYVIYAKGKLLTDGKIEMSDEIKAPLQGRKNEP